MVNRKLENAHVALWLLKDCSWCSSWHWLGMAMAIPTLVIAGRIAWESRRSVSETVHNVAVCLWIVANITWMTGEFFFEDGTRAIAKLFFFAGLVLLVGYYGWEAGPPLRSFVNGDVVE